MKNELERVLNFEGNEVKVRTSEGVELFNLANSCKVLGITINDKKKNTIRVQWKGNRSILDRLNKLKQSICSSEADASPQYIEEIDYILDEIENSDDRNSIFMSRYLTSRIAMSMNSPKASQYQDWLAKLDESYSKGELTVTNQELSNIVSSTVNSILPTLINEMTNNLIPTVVEARNQVTNMQNLMKDQSLIYDTERTELKEMIGMRSKNVKQLTDKLKYELEEYYKEPINAKDTFYINAKNRIFKEFRVLRWEQIPVQKYNNVFAYIEEMFDK